MLNIALSASGGLGTAAIYAVLGYLVVFIGLVLLMGAIIVTGKVMASRKAEPAAAAPAKAAAPAPAPVKEAPPAPGSAGEVKLYGVPDKEAAMLMAIVADKMGKPVNELRFKSIKEVK